MNRPSPSYVVDPGIDWLPVNDHPAPKNKAIRLWDVIASDKKGIPTTPKMVSNRELMEMRQFYLKDGFPTPIVVQADAIGGQMCVDYDFNEASTFSKVYADLGNPTPPVVPPFDQWFVESWAHLNTFPTPVLVGALLSVAWTPDTPPNVIRSAGWESIVPQGGWGVRVDFFMQSYMTGSSRPWGFFLGTRFWCLDDQGSISRVAESFDGAPDGSTDDPEGSWYRRFITGLAVRTTALMHCKNVELVEPLTDASRQQRRQVERQRRKYPDIVFKELAIIPSGKHAPAQRMTQTELRAHLVRGHFKHYTEEAPLFGKLTGTWWWSPSLRGNPANGIVVKDYVVPEVG